MRKSRVFVSIMSLLVIAGAARLHAEKIWEPTGDQVNAAELWKWIKKGDNYLKYSFWPNHLGMNPGRAPHGPYHKIYVNDVLINALPISDRVAPYGGIIVKEAYDTDKEMVNISVMVKVKDFNPDANDWFWAQYSPEGKVMASGKLSPCIGCHKAFKSNDFVIVHKLDK